jgi:hypothetical protein
MRYAIVVPTYILPLYDIVHKTQPCTQLGFNGTTQLKAGTAFPEVLANSSVNKALAPHRVGNKQHCYTLLMHTGPS